jgi:transposase
MSTRGRRRFSAEEKLRIVEEGRQSGATISEVCRRNQIASSQFYKWEKQAREGALARLKNGKAGRKTDEATQAALKAELQRLQAVVAEVVAENLELKKGRWP